MSAVRWAGCPPSDQDVHRPIMGWMSAVPRRLVRRLVSWMSTVFFMLGENHLGLKDMPCKIASSPEEALEVLQRHP
jgi:hypothetical protein